MSRALCLPIVFQLNLAVVIPGTPSTAFETSSLVDLISDDGTVLLNVPLGSSNSLNNSCKVFGTGLKYFRIEIFTHG